MPSLLNCLLCAALIIPTFCAPTFAWAEPCNELFAGGRPPVLVNLKLAQRTTELCNKAYASLASGLTKGPLWSAEHLTAESLAAARNTPREGSFHEEERLSSADRANLSDYVRSSYERGHMTPSGDMPDPASQQESFSLANVVPQKSALNRGVWEGIESAVRRLAENQGGLYVVTGPSFQGRRLRTLKGRVLVPTSTWKAIYDTATQGAAAYLCTNVGHPKCATLSVAALIQQTGVDPFPGVPAAVKLTAMTLPPPEPSRYASGSHARERHRRSDSGQGVFGELFH